MKKVFLVAASAMLVLSSCNSGMNGELTGAPNRPAAYAEADPYGMVFVPQGSFTMGPNDQDVPFTLTAQSKTVTVDPFWMDDTEITNNEYRQFVEWVRDSIAMRLCVIAGVGDNGKGNIFVYPYDEDQVDPNEYDPTDTKNCWLNWENRDKVWQKGKGEESQAISDAVKEMFLIKEERFNKLHEIDTRKLIYDYEWVDLKQAALKQNRYNFNEDFSTLD